MLIYVVLLILISLFTSCNGGNMPNKIVSFRTLNDVPKSKWEALSQKRIFFGHQSVGYNIIDGIKNIMQEHSFIKLKIIETTNPDDFDFPIFAHTRVGKNTDPVSKCDAFANFLEKGIGDKVDIAFFKFCYVDITAKSDVEKVFLYYKQTLQHLEKKYPKTIFIHCTVPLTLPKATFKRKIKLLLSLKSIHTFETRVQEDNIKRNQFNEMLRNEYKNKEPIFDLALIESTFPNGRRAFFKRSSKIYYSLVPDYTYDGGHLNELGRKIVAEQLLIFLANL